MAWCAKLVHWICCNHRAVKNFRLGLNVANITDKKAPYYPAAHTSTIVTNGYKDGLHSGTGRYFTLSANYAFRGVNAWCAWMARWKSRANALMRRVDDRCSRTTIHHERVLGVTRGSFDSECPWRDIAVKQCIDLQRKSSFGPSLAHAAGRRFAQWCALILIGGRAGHTAASAVCQAVSCSPRGQHE